jgi:superfamily II DNA or RNA helicase
MTSVHPLRPYQTRTIDLLSQSFREGNRRIVLALPTGSGKTLISSEIFRRAAGNSKKGTLLFRGWS